MFPTPWPLCWWRRAIGPDILYRGYFFDILRHARTGVPNLPVGLPTANGGRVRLFQICNLHVERDLTYHETPKRLSDPPTCFADYRGQLLRTVTKVAENAAAPERNRTYRLVSAVSRGYDSTAVAALASQAGGREAVTYRRSNGGRELVDDSGAEIASYLGMTTTAYERMDVRSLDGFPEAEFFSKPDGNAAFGLRLMQAQFEGALFMTGRHGEDVWGLGRDCIRKGLREPENTTMPSRGLADFRIRVGYLNFPVPYIGALHGSHTYRITHAREMDPWRLGVGKYDRPIARRIAEEAGVPRALFGQRKIGGGGPGLRRLNDASEQDFRAFCQAEAPEEILGKLDHRKAFERDREHFRMSFIRKRCARHPTLHPLLNLLPLDRWHAMWNSVYLYTFHWGFERISPRYRV